MLKIAFIADYFEDDLAGGAELSTKALLDRIPGKESEDFILKKIKSLNVNNEMLDGLKGYLLIFGNFTYLKYTLLKRIAHDFDYCIIEYDYKFCMHRSIEVHKQQESTECDCDKYFGQDIADFFLRAKTIFWMSTKQLKIYLKRFPRLIETYSVVLSSVFSREDLKLIRELRTSTHDKTGYAYQASGNWLKGIENAEKYCEENNLTGKPLLKMNHKKFLAHLACSEGFVYLPNAGDSCPRITIEAKLLGCKLVTNGHVQQGGELWFNKSIEEIEAYLDQTPERFWQKIQSLNQEKRELIKHG